MKTKTVLQPKHYKYIPYIRKSEEREERQQLSHGAQFDKIKHHFPDLTYADAGKYIESGSAFKPYNRPLFDDMMNRIEAGEIQGIVAYHPNRLARNEIEAAQVTYFLRTGVLKDLKFCTYTFENTPEGIMMLQIHLSQGQYESSKQSREVARGMEAKVKTQQERPGRVPPGYMKEPIKDERGNFLKDKDGDLVTATQSDPDRFDLVKRMWQLFLSGTYTAPQIRKLANEEWKFTLKPTAKTGGEPMGLSTIYRIFTNPYYAGWIRHNGELYEGKHAAMITLEQYDYAQQLLGAKGKPRVSANDYAYTALIRCGVCGCRVAGKTNKKFVKRENQVVTYVHYHCIRKSEERPCNQNVYTRLDKLEDDIEAQLAKYAIRPDFLDLALKILHRDNDIEVTERSLIYRTQQKRRERIQTDLDGLVDMRLHQQLDEDEYTAKRSKLKLELSKIDEQLRGTEARADDWLELTERAFNFAVYAPIHFRETKDLRVKRDILLTLGVNFSLKDQKLSLEPYGWLEIIANNYPALEAEFLKVRTKKKPLPSQHEDISANWRAIWDSNPGHAA